MINYRLAAPELQFVLNDSEAVVLFVSDEFYDIAAQVLGDCPHIKTIIAIEGGHDAWPDYSVWRDEQVGEDPMLTSEDRDDVVQLYTSGTTGRPKGVQLMNQNFRVFFTQAETLTWAKYDEGDPVIDAMPLFHIAGLNIGLLSLVQGAKAVILREINPMVILDLIEQQKIRHGFLVPAVILILTQISGVEKRDFSSFKIMAYGASPIAESLLLKAAELFGCQFSQVYGLTETAGVGTYMLPEDHDPARGKLRSCGIPYPGTQIRCVDEDGKEVAQGDVGEITIKSGVVMKGYWNRPEVNAKTRIAGYKCPKSVDISTEPLPRNASGKVLRRQLRAPFWEGRERNVG